MIVTGVIAAVIATAMTIQTGFEIVWLADLCFGQEKPQKIEVTNWNDFKPQEIKQRSSRKGHARRGSQQRKLSEKRNSN